VCKCQSTTKTPEQETSTDRREYVRRVPADRIAEEVEIEEADTPLAEQPPIIIEPEEIASFEIIDEEVPLSQMPQTGVTGSMLLWIVGLFGSMTALGATGLKVKKTSKED